MLETEIETKRKNRSEGDAALTPKRKTKIIRKRMIVEQEVDDTGPDPKQYETVRFRFYNEEQRGVPVDYEWIDKYTPPGKCKGVFRDGQTYTVPRVAFEYYRDQCSTPIFKNIEHEVVPGQTMRASQETGRNYRFRLEVC